MHPKKAGWGFGAKKGDEDDGLFPRMSFRSIVFKTMLLNLGVLLTVLPFMLPGEANRQVLPGLLFVMGGVSALIWILTFVITGLVMSTGILIRQFAAPVRHGGRKRDGIVDHWIDDPVC